MLFCLNMWMDPQQLWMVSTSLKWCLQHKAVQQARGRVRSQPVQCQHIHALGQGLEPLPNNTESATACLNKSCSWVNGVWQHNLHQHWTLRLVGWLWLWLWLLLWWWWWWLLLFMYDPLSHFWNCALGRSPVRVFVELTASKSDGHDRMTNMPSGLPEQGADWGQMTL